MPRRDRVTIGYRWTVGVVESEDKTDEGAEPGEESARKEGLPESVSAAADPEAALAAADPEGVGERSGVRVGVAGVFATGAEVLSADVLPSGDVGLFGTAEKSEE